MNRVYDEKKIRYYIQKHHIDKIIPNILKLEEERLSLLYGEKGEVLAYEGEQERLIFLIEGSVKNFVLTKNGKKLLLHFADGFEILRDLEFLGIRNPNVGIECIGKTIFLNVNLKGYRELILDNPAFLREMLGQIGNKLYKTTIAQTMTAAYRLDNRLASYILKMSEKKSNGRLVFDENLTDTAELLGTSYRHLLRTIKEFCDEKIIIRTNRGYEVNNIDWLNEKASDQPIYVKYHV